MKIEKRSNGNVWVFKDSGEIEAVFNSKAIIQKYPRDEKMILISATPSEQDTNESYYIDSTRVSELIIGGVATAWTGIREALMHELSEQFFFETAGSVTISGGSTETKQDEIIQKLTPVNWATTFTYNAKDNIETETRTHGTVSQSRTYTWQGDNLINISAWA